jgi:hypothetical protein
MNTTKSKLEVIEKKVEKKASTLLKLLGIVSAILVTIGTIVGGYLDIIDKIHRKTKENDFVMTQIINDYNRRIIKLETFLMIAQRHGMFGNLQYDEFERTREEIYNTLNGTYKLELSDKCAILEPTEDGNRVSIINTQKVDSLRTLKDYKKEFQQTQKNK